jgi:tRNA threonylcarbamoyladenosine biosynthesis protein TsaB
MILLWNSASMTVTMSLVDNEQQYDYTWEAGRSLAHDMLSYLRDKLAEHHATFDDISGIGAFRGPGSFTGLRIGLTVLNTIATDKKIPIVGVTDDDWQSACKKRLNSGENDQIVMPEYGGDAHITAPRK